MQVNPMVCWALLVMLLALVASPAGAAEPAAESTDVRHLELGDGYEVVVRREGVEARYSGKLIQMTDEWLVLRTLSEGRNEYGVPIVSKVPYAGRLFRNVGIGRATTDRWIPRAAATVVGRSLADQPGEMVKLMADQPNWEQVYRVEFAEAGEAHDHSGEITLEGSTLHYTVGIGHEVDVPMPLLGQLPGVGPLFTTRETVFRAEGREVPIGSVLSVVEPAPGERVEFDFD
jgi:hypothetical protein